MFLKQCKIAQDTSRLTARTKVLTFDGDNEFLFVYTSGLGVGWLYHSTRVTGSFNENSKRAVTVTVLV